MKKITLLLSSLLVAVFLSGCSQQKEVNNNQITASSPANQQPTQSVDISSQSSDSGDGLPSEIKYQDERLKALSTVQAYRIKKPLNMSTKYQVNAGTKLFDVFKQQKQAGLIQQDGRWVVLKDNNRIVVIYRNKLSDGFTSDAVSNDVQWAVINDNIYAINGKAKSYTPELGQVDVSVNQSKEVQFYLKWEKLMEADNWDEARNQINEDKVAREFSVTNSEADRMLMQGEQEKNTYAKNENDRRGDVLSDQRTLELLKDQGDLYIPE